MVFGLATPAIDVFVEHASVAFVQIGDDEARVGPFGASLDAGDDALDAAPALRAVEELLETADLAISGRGFETRLYAGLEDFDVSAQPSAPVPERTTQTVRAPYSRAREFNRKSKGSRAPCRACGFESRNAPFSSAER